MQNAFQKGANPKKFGRISGRGVVKNTKIKPKNKNNIVKSIFCVQIV